MAGRFVTTLLLEAGEAGGRNLLAPRLAVRRRWGAAPHGGLAAHVADVYEKLASPEDSARTEATGEVPVIRDGRRGCEPLETLTLKDLPTILDTCAVLDEELKMQELEESERKAAERKERERVRAK